MAHKISHPQTGVHRTRQFGPWYPWTWTCGLCGYECKTAWTDKWVVKTYYRTHLEKHHGA